MILSQLPSMLRNSSRDNLGWYRIPVKDKLVIYELTNHLRKSGYLVQVEPYADNWRVSFKR